jgi:tRNA threonylcarbamoyladenosine biosynthesis protein TsaB
MSTLLALETSTHACSAALLHQGQRYSRSVVAPREHAERILGMVAELIDEAGISLSALQGIAFGQGPGSFLGTRIAAGVAQGLGFALNIPLFPVSSLQALAQHAVERHQATEVIASWDARMDSLYWGHYTLKDDRLQAVKADGISTPANFSVPVFSGLAPLLVGNAWQVYRDSLHESVQIILKKQPSELTEFYPEAQFLLPEAKHLFKKSLGVRACEAGPVYLRDPVSR